MASKETLDLRTKIAEAINSVSAENGSDTPDFILAEFLQNTLRSFDAAVIAREKWYGRGSTADDGPFEG